MTNNIYVIIFLVSCFEALAQSCIYYSHYTKNNIYLVLAIGFYICVCFTVYTAYNYKGIGMVNALWSAIDIVLLLIVGVLIFNEKLSKNEYIGILFIIIGIILTSKNVVPGKSKVHSRDATPLKI
jgi:multidrug transporter EmrE-like cation transporter